MSVLYFCLFLKKNSTVAQKFRNISQVFLLPNAQTDTKSSKIHKDAYTERIKTWPNITYIGKYPQSLFIGVTTDTIKKIISNLLKSVFLLLVHCPFLLCRCDSQLLFFYNSFMQFFQLRFFLEIGNAFLEEHPHLTYELRMLKTWETILESLPQLVIQM